MPLPVCRSCGPTAPTWAPTFCNHAHCAVCFKPIDPDHECSWDGTEHSSFKPAYLPGNVHNPEVP